VSPPPDEKTGFRKWLSATFSWWDSEQFAKAVSIAIGVLLVLGLAAVLVAASKAFWPYLSAEGSGSCPPGQSANVASTKRPQWKLTAPKDAKVVLAMDDWVNQPIEARSFVRVRATGSSRRKKPLPASTKLRAFVLGGLARETRSLQLQPTAIAARAPDGRSVQVTLCARRLAPDLKFWRESPGRYTGTLRVAGQRASGAEIPVELTIRAQRYLVALTALLASLLGAGVAAWNARPAQVDSDAVRDAGRRYRFADFVLLIAPFVGGLIAGLLAAFTIYADDPTFGSNLGSDGPKLITAAFAAAAVGLTVTAPVARGTRQRLSSSAVESQGSAHG
jgi:hypothetical protein